MFHDYGKPVVCILKAHFAIKHISQIEMLSEGILDLGIPRSAHGSGLTKFSHTRNLMKELVDGDK